MAGKRWKPVGRAVLALAVSLAFVGVCLRISRAAPSSPAVYALVPGAVVGLALTQGRAHETAFLVAGLVVNVLFYWIVTGLLLWLLSSWMRRRKSTGRAS